MTLKLFQFEEQFMIDFFVKFTQIEKTGSTRKTFFSLGNLIINFHFQNQKSITFFVTFTVLLFDSGVCHPFNNGNALNLKKITSQTAKKSNQHEQILRLIPEKKNQQDHYKSTHDYVSNCIIPEWHKNGKKNKCIKKIESNFFVNNVGNFSSFQFKC